MTIIDRFNSQEDFLKFRDHLGTVMAEKMSLPLKPRKLDELVAMVVGAKDFNTALGMIASAPKAAAEERMILPAILSTTDGSRSVKFDAAIYFHNISDNRSLSLMQTLKEILEGETAIGSDPFMDIAEYFTEINYPVCDLFCHVRNINKSGDRWQPIGLECHIETKDIVAYLMEYGETVLATWVDAYEAGFSIGDCAQEATSAIHHGNTDCEVEKFLRSMGSDFQISFVPKMHTQSYYKWTYQGRSSDETSSELFTRMDAIVNFLDNSIENPKTDFIEETAFRWPHEI
jgi:hypothetical protein